MYFTSYGKFLVLLETRGVTVDDKQANVAASEAVGMKGLHFLHIDKNGLPVDSAEVWLDSINGVVRLESMGKICKLVNSVALWAYQASIGQQRFVVFIGFVSSMNPTDVVFTKEKNSVYIDCFISS